MGAYDRRSGPDATTIDIIADSCAAVLIAPPSFARGPQDTGRSGRQDREPGHYTERKAAPPSPTKERSAPQFAPKATTFDSCHYLPGR